MDIAALWAEIENEYSWRIDEIRFFQNQLNKLSSDSEKDQFRRALVLLLYAHYEGFCKFAFSLYVSAVNKAAIKCDEASFAIAAAALDNIFNELRHPDSKSSEFRHTLPEDKKLHIFARNVEFVEKSSGFGTKLVNIPDSVVDTESNLKPVVLRKNLYKLGFPYDALKDVEGDINMLLNLRNNIAHGATRQVIPLPQFQALQESTRKIMARVKSYVMSALQSKTFMKAV